MSPDPAQAESEAERYLRYAGYVWLVQAGLWSLVAVGLFLVGSVETAILFGVVLVAGPVLIYRGLRRGSTLAWFVHMGLSLLAATSIVGLLGLYFGWKGREAAEADYDTGDEPSGQDEQRPSPSAPTAPRSPAGEGSTDAHESDDTTGRRTDDGDDDDDGIEYWGVDDEPRPTGDWGDDS